MGMVQRFQLRASDGETEYWCSSLAQNSFIMEWMSLEQADWRTDLGTPIEYIYIIIELILNRVDTVMLDSITI
jgi:hypothetical protein